MQHYTLQTSTVQFETPYTNLQEYEQWDETDKKELKLYAKNVETKY